MRTFNTEITDKLIFGRVEPHIYAFSTGRVPEYLKVGDTYRPVSIRLQEWRTYFPNLKQQYDHIAKTENGKYYRDFEVHKFLVDIKGLHRLQPDDIKDIPYYSREFFKNATPKELDEAVVDIDGFSTKNGQTRYHYYTEDRLPEEPHFAREETYDLRPNQKKTVEAFIAARKKGRKKLLMYAVMRFGKSFTSMCCALEMKAKVVLVVSAKADVREEWQRTVESHKKFENYEFIYSTKLLQDSEIISKRLNEGKNVVVSLTLQDLMGDDIKTKHQDLFKQHIDLLIVDETHYGARAKEYGKILKDSGLKQTSIDKELKDADDDLDNLYEGLEVTKSLDVDMTLHLSGTPYRILMGGEFENEDIIAFYQFTHILEDKEKWDKEYLEQENPQTKKPYDEWDNPYYGFPQMIRFAFSPSERARELIKRLPKQGKTAALNELFKPMSISKDREGLYKRFENEKEVLELLQVIDGSKEEEGLFGFLNYDKLKEGKMCHHMVFVLPFCASCDAMEALLIKNKRKFKNLQEYKIINIAGKDCIKADNEEIKRRITETEKVGEKTISLTVNKMLTGCTVPEWDTMLFLKDVSSPQEYDQAIFRLQNQFVKTLMNGDEKIKYNMKPQTLLVDFDVNRMFRMQERKALIYNINTEESGNNELEDRLRRELEISPIIILNKDKLIEATPTDIMDAVREYSATRTVMEEAEEIPIDFGLLKVGEIKKMLEQEADIDSKKGIEQPATKEGTGEYEGLEGGNTPQSEQEQPVETEATQEEDKEETNWRKKFTTYYSRILFYAFLTDSKVNSLSDILADINKGKENTRIIKNIGIESNVLKLFRKHIDPLALNTLDYKIKNINEQSRDVSNEPEVRVERALTRFGRLSSSEIVTPPEIAKEMIEQISEKDVTTKTKFLDIAAKEGEFACALYKKFREKSKNNIYSLPTSALTYEFTLKVYKLLGMPLENVIADFNSYDLIKSTNKEQYIERLTNMQFNIVVGNPPYHENISDSEANKSLGKQLFPEFTKLAVQLSNQCVTLITPSRWFKGNAQDRSFVKLREFFQENNHIDSMCSYTNTNDVFSNVTIKGGVSYFRYKHNYEGDVTFINKSKGISQQRPLFEDGLDVILGDAFEYRMIQSVIQNNFTSLVTITTGRNAFGIIGKEEELFAISKDKQFNGACPILCKNGVKRWIKEETVRKSIDIFNHYKVFISKSAGDPAKDDQIISHPYIGEPKEACTDTFFPIGCFESKKEAIALSKYLCTKFVRYMVSVLKVSQNVTQIVYKYVPLQDFTANSDIDWSKSVDDIDKQLYKKYKLSRDEAAFIDATIKPM